MESLAPQPANADNTAPVDTDNADAEAVDTKGDGSAPSVPEADTPKPDKVQERIDKLTRDKYDALRDRDRTSYEVERLTARLAELEKAPTKQVAPANEFPTLEQFGYDESKFIAAVVAHSSQLSTTQARAAAREIIEAEREATRTESVVKSWAKKEADFIKSKPDYVEKVLEARTLPISREIQMELRESELGPQIAYYLVENPEKAAAIMGLPLKAQLKEIGRIEATLEATKPSAKPAVSQAPPPVSKVEADDAPAVVRVDGAESDQLSDKEWTRRRNAQEAARLRKRNG